MDLINKIHRGNCFDLLPELGLGTVDLVVTDPPYLTALADIYSSWNLKNHDFEVLAEQLERVMAPNGQIAIFCDYLTSLSIGNAFQKYFTFRYYYIWIKSNGQPVNAMQPRSNVELVLVWKKKSAKTSDLTYNPILKAGVPYSRTHKGGNCTRKKSTGYTTINNGYRTPDQTLYYPSKDNMLKKERSNHPCQKSVGLMAYFIRTLSNESDLVLDPFAGSGSTAIACHRLNRNWIAMEKDPNYYCEAKERLRVETSQLSLV